MDFESASSRAAYRETRLVRGSSVSTGKVGRGVLITLFFFLFLVQKRKQMIIAKMKKNKKTRRRKGLVKLHIVASPPFSGGRSVIWYNYPLRKKATTTAATLASLSLSLSLFNCNSDLPLVNNSSHQSIVLLSFSHPCSLEANQAKPSHICVHQLCFDSFLFYFFFSLKKKKNQRSKYDSSHSHYTYSSVKLYRLFLCLAQRQRVASTNGLCSCVFLLLPPLSCLILCNELLKCTSGEAETAVWLSPLLSS